MMRKDIIFVETVVTSLDPERTIRLADECLIEIRLIESRKESAMWMYEYEIKGEAGKVEKFSARLKSIESDPTAWA
jgi:hypothetical protein